MNGNFVQILFWTVVCFVSHHILLFPQIEIGFKIIIYNSLLNYIKYIDIYWKYWNVLIYIAVYCYIFLSIKLVWVVIDHIILPTIILCVFSCQSVYVWFISYLFVWGCIIIFIVLLHVLCCLAMKVNHSIDLRWVVNPVLGVSSLSCKSISVWMESIWFWLSSVIISAHQQL